MWAVIRMVFGYYLTSSFIFSINLTFVLPIKQQLVVSSLFRTASDVCGHQKWQQSGSSSRFPPLSAENRSTTSSRPVRSVKMSATGTGGCGPGPASGTGSGASNPRKFSEKIALLTQRQAEGTAAFQEVMMDITSTRVSLRRRQEEESCPEEERPCLGLSGSKIMLHGCLYMAPCSDLVRL